MRLIYNNGAMATWSKKSIERKKKPIKKKKL